MPKAKIMVVLTGFATTAIFANFFPARADELNDLSQQSIINPVAD